MFRNKLQKATIINLSVSVYLSRSLSICTSPSISYLSLLYLSSISASFTILCPFSLITSPSSLSLSLYSLSLSLFSLSLSLLLFPACPITAFALPLHLQDVPLFPFRDCIEPIHDLTPTGQIDRDSQTMPELLERANSPLAVGFESRPILRLQKKTNFEAFSSLQSRLKHELPVHGTSPHVLTKDFLISPLSRKWA